MIFLCLQKVQKGLGNCEESGFLAIPYLDGQFDFAVTSFALHHISDEQKLLALDEMRQVLKPHGTICITDLIFENEMKKDQYLHHLKGKGGTDILDVIQNEHVSLCSDLLRWFDENGYIVYAVPTR